ncbi:MAG: CdaR family protein [Anaerolineae bacterium]
MKRWIIQNVSLVFLSLILAFFFWAVATEAEDPTIRDTYGSTLPVEIRGLPEDMIAYGAENARVRVEIRAPASVWDDLSADAIDAYLVLSDVETGTLEVPVQVAISAEPLDITQVTPETIEITVERIAEKEVPVNLRIQGAPATGFQVGSAEIAPQSIRVRGPESRVREAAVARITVSLSDQRNDVRGDYEPEVLDAAGDPVARIELTPRTVTVNVPLEPLAQYREIAIDPSVEGQPPPGYRVAGLSVQPPTVNVVGRAEVVRETSAIQTEPISLEGITQTVTTTVALRMPSGLSIISPPSPRVTVTLSVEIIRSGLTLEVIPQVQGISENLTATVGLDSVLVILSGPLATMETLEPSAVELTLDLTNMTPGEYSIVPQVTVPEDVDIENIVPEAIPVRVESLEEPEPNSE